MLGCGPMESMCRSQARHMMLLGVGLGAKTKQAVSLQAVRQHLDCAACLPLLL
jgi:hypothetical protein